MGTGHYTLSDEATKQISARLFCLWDAWKNQDSTAHSAMLTDDYRAVYADGTLRTGKPSTKEIAAAPILGYDLSSVQMTALGPEAVLVTYVAAVELPASGHSPEVRLAAAEVWAKQHGKWMCRYFHGTLLK